MIRLTLFGQCDLVDSDGRPVQALLKQRKQLAVLSYLALAGTGGVHSRDTAIGLFWPDATQRKARHALSQVIHSLREALGSAVVVSRGRDEVGVCADVIWCDAVAFDRALKRGDATEALELYRGELLPGFFISAGPEFEHWLGDQRDRYRRSATAAAWQLAESAEKNGQLRTAVEWGTRAVETSLNDEASVQSLLRLLDRTDDRAGALHAYLAFKRRLAREYDIEPSATTIQLVAHIRARTEGLPRLDPEQGQAIGTEHERYISWSQGGTSQPALITKELPLAIAGSHANARQKIVRLVVSAVIVAGLACVAVWGVHGSMFGPNGSKAHGRTSVVVEPLTALDTSSASASLSHALTDAVVDQLEQVRSFDVTVPELESPSGKRSESTRSLSPQLLLTGNVIQLQGRVRVTVRITDAVSGRAVRSAVLDHTAGAQMAVIDVLSREISSLVRTTEGHEVRLREWSDALKNGRVYELMQQVDEDRDMANQLEGSGNFPAAARALRTADSALARVEIMAPRWAEPMVEQAGILQRLGALYVIPPLRDTALVKTLLGQGISVSSRAVSLDRRNAAALESLGTLSYWYWLMVPVPPDSASRLLARSEQMLQTSVAADPDRSEAWSLLSAVLYSRADYSGAYLAANRAYHADAYLENPQEILSALSGTSYEIGDDSTSRYWCDELNRQFEGSWPGAYCRLNLLAWNGGDGAPANVIAQAWKIATDTAWSSAPEQRIEPYFQMLAAAVLARYGLRDSAESVLRRAGNASATGDPETVPLEAYVRLLLGQDEAATNALTRYVTGRPLHRAGVVRSRRFAGLSGLQRELTLLKIPQAVR